MIGLPWYGSCYRADNMSDEMGLGDYLHALELWRDGIRTWWRSIPAGARNLLLPDLARLACLHDAARTRARLLRRMLGHEEPLPRELELSLADLATSLVLVMRRMRLAFATLTTDAASMGLAEPPSPPIGGICLEAGDGILSGPLPSVLPAGTASGSRSAMR